MRRESSLPPEFGDIRDKLHYVQKVSSNEWSSECVFCGGTPHPSGEWPDRMRHWLNSRRGGTLSWCRSCSRVWIPNNSKPPTPEQLEAWRREAEADERRRKAEAEQALANLQIDKVWEMYHALLDEYARTLWERRGIPRFWQDWWQLGYDPAHTFFYKDAEGEVREHTTATLTIPVWDAGWQAQNLKHRLITPVPGRGDRYRLERKGLPPVLFIAEPDRAMKGACVLVEGEIKAMVVASRLDDPRYQVAGIPSKTPDPASLDKLKDCEPIYLVPDPDALRSAVDAQGRRSLPAAVRLANLLGRERCRLVVVPDKIDDWMVRRDLGAHWLRHMLATGRRM